MAVITKEQVFKTCDQLKRIQGRFTQAEVVALSGGSLTKVGPWVREWQQLDRATEAYADLSPLLLDQLNKWCHQLKQELAAETHAPLVEAEEQLDILKQRLVEMTERATAAERELEAQQQEQVRQQDSIRSMERSLKKLDDRLKETEQQHQGEILRVSALLETAEKREHQGQQELKAQQDRAAELLKEERARITGIFEANENKLFLQLDQLRQAQQLERTEYNKSDRELRKACQKLEQTCAQLEQKMAVQGEKLEQQKSLNEQIRQQAVNYQEQLKQFQVAHTEAEQARNRTERGLEAKLARTQGERDQAKAIGERLSLQVDQLQQRLINLVAQSQAPED